MVEIYPNEEKHEITATKDIVFKWGQHTVKAFLKSFLTTSVSFCFCFSFAQLIKSEDSQWWFCEKLDQHRLNENLVWVN